MANVNYSNPGGMFPQIDYKPSGFLGGFLTGKKLQDYQHSFDLSSLASQMGIMQQGAEYQNYLKDSPLRDVKRQYEIAQKGAEMPHLSTIAQGNAAHAQGMIDQTPMKTEQMRFDNSKKQEDAVREQVGNYLNAIMRSPLPPQEKIMAWKRLSQQLGVPEKYQNLDLNQMQLVASALTQGPGYHQAMDSTKLKEEGDTSRKRMDNETDLKVAGIRASTDRGVAGTAASQRASAIDEWQKAYISQNAAVRGIEPNTPQYQSLVNEAKMRGIEMGYGGNPTGRAESTVATETARDQRKMTQREMRGARIVESKEDSKTLRVGEVFKLPNGKYYRKINNEDADEVTLGN